MRQVPPAFGKFIDLLALDARGGLTVIELKRMVWAQGDGSTLEVYDTSLGKLSGLICWENYMPLAHYSLYA